MKHTIHSKSCEEWPVTRIRKQLVGGRMVYVDLGMALGWIKKDRRRGNFSIVGIERDELLVYISNPNVAMDFKLRFG